MTPAGRVPSDNPVAGSRIFAFGIRNSYGFTFDAQTGNLWETENGPECNDEINLIVAGGNFGWGPNESCSGDSPGNTNNSGPAPRRRPRLWFVGTIGITGDAFCDGCGLGASVDGSLFFGDVNTGVVRRVALNAARDDVSGSAIDVLDTPGGVYSMETSPNGRVYFSDAHAIYRLAPAETDAGDDRSPGSTLLTDIREGTDMDIGQPKRIIEVEPASLPLPEAIPAP